MAKNTVKKKNTLGFTLVELVAVMVIIGIIGVMGTRFIVNAIDSYQQTETRSKLIARGRVSVEQITRQLRNALPNAIRISDTGNCLEFFPIVKGVNYLNAVADEGNGASSSSTIITAPFTITSVEAADIAYAAIGGLSNAEIYTLNVPSSLASINLLGASPYTSVTLSSAHRFNRNSITGRLYLVSNPNRFCLQNGALRQYNGYGLDTGNLDDSYPGGGSFLLDENVSVPTKSVLSAPGKAFELSPGSEERNTAIYIALVFSDRKESVTLNSKVLVRNVP
ncbi:prepilin-type N-terminal cleavage/methylation domain-containing protein [Teredinibacter haidensis]|uniref:prepilin-type N-terminal cleavage/methylation domain-containing protein n=1 Tax=Teredinibacter haidensis TaxID=2731755 RepID=UPI000948BCE5|nr:prepilin-type N-terminal cleavage/methylation domain-containing protein [Teredinibacter haidensis]